MLLSLSPQDVDRSLFELAYEIDDETTIPENIVAVSAASLTHFDTERLGLSPQEVRRWDILAQRSAIAGSFDRNKAGNEQPEVKGLAIDAADLRRLGSALMYYADREDEALNLILPGPGAENNARLRRLYTDIAVDLLDQVEDEVTVPTLWTPAEPVTHFGYNNHHVQ